MSFLKKKKGGEQVRFDFTIHVKELTPWPPRDRQIAIAWQRGSKRKGCTQSQAPAKRGGQLCNTYCFNETFQIPATLYREAPSSDTSKTRGFRRKCLVLAVLETEGRARATSVLGKLVINLAEYAGYDVEEFLRFPVTCSQAIVAAVGQPYLRLDLVCQWQNKQVPGGSAPSLSGNSSVSTDTSNSTLSSHLSSFMRRTRTSSLLSGKEDNVQQQLAELDVFEEGIGETPPRHAVQARAPSRLSGEDGGVPKHNAMFKAELKPEADLWEAQDRQGRVSPRRSSGTKPFALEAIAEGDSAEGSPFKAKAGVPGTDTRTSVKMDKVSQWLSSSEPAEQEARAEAQGARPKEMEPGMGNPFGEDLRQPWKMESTGPVLGQDHTRAEMRSADGSGANPFNESTNPFKATDDVEGGGGASLRDQTNPFRGAPTADWQQAQSETAYENPFCSPEVGAATQGAAVGPTGDGILPANPFEPPPRQGGGHLPVDAAHDIASPFEAFLANPFEDSSRGPAEGGDSRGLVVEQLPTSASSPQTPASTSEAAAGDPSEYVCSPTSTSDQARPCGGGKAHSQSLASETLESPFLSSQAAANGASAVHAAESSPAGRQKGSHERAAPDHRCSEELHRSAVREQRRQAGERRCSRLARSSRGAMAGCSDTLADLAGGLADRLGYHGAVAQATLELQTLAAAEAAIYWARRQGGGSLRLRTRRSHQPARRLARTIACLGPSRGLHFGQAAMKAIRSMADSLGEDVAGLVFWWSNCVALRALISSGCLGGGDCLSREHVWRRTEEETCEAAGELELHLFERALQTVWWRVLVPSVASSDAHKRRAIGHRRRHAAPGGAAPDESVATLRWLDALEAVRARLCSPGLWQAGGHARLMAARILSLTMRRIDLVLFACLLSGGVDLPLPHAMLSTDPGALAEVQYLFPNLDEAVLPFSEGPLTFASGMGIKFMVSRLEAWAAEAGVSAAGGAAPKQGEKADSCDLFPRLRSAANMLMLPKRALADAEIRADACPALDLLHLTVLLERFKPDEYSADTAPPQLVKRLRQEALTAEHLKDSEALDGVYGKPQAHGLLQAPTQKVELPEAVAYWNPGGSSCQKLPSLDFDSESEEELEELAIEVGKHRQSSLHTGVANENRVSSSCQRFRLLRDLWRSL
uniref:C2 NT-type domain-containing protein n=2 Tax=Tetraselmis sp. GSL018 TaxID=582737 RepID=A0A061SC45_9CHLO|mmetsp:Transcript_19135/g.45631  ORF Transcript_19135/g.45631 Transcript_19135/m.45631 type:complete len:1155 (-) Transcript_19135:23-3487(-)